MEVAPPFQLPIVDKLAQYLGREVDAQVCVGGGGRKVFARYGGRVGERGKGGVRGDRGAARGVGVVRGVRVGSFKWPRVPASLYACRPPASLYACHPPACLPACLPACMHAHLRLPACLCMHTRVCARVYNM